MSNESSTQDIHFIATSARNTWQRARTRKEAVENLRRATPTSSLQTDIIHNGGMDVHSFQVNAPSTEMYPVVDGIPQGVETEDERVHKIVSLNGRIVGDPVD